MKIGIMARTLDDSDGVGVANRNLIEKMVNLTEDTEYVIFYQTRTHFGRYKNYSQVKEVLLTAPSRFIWDQLLVPYFARKANVDVLFNPKYTVPLLTKRPTVPVCQGLPYYDFAQFHEWQDVMYAKFFLPKYYKKAAKVIAISDNIQDLLNRHVRVPYEKMETVYLAADDSYSPRTNKKELQDFRDKYHLPENFILTVTAPYQRGKMNNRKNIDNVVKAFLDVRDRHPSLKLVFAGTKCHRYVSTVFGRETADDPGLVYPGWIPQEDMPYLYSLARLLIFPSYYESFGLPIVEAMACGCPVVTSTYTSCPEIAGDAGIVVDPTDVAGLSTAMDSILTNLELSQRLSEKGLKRASEFSWARSAERTIEICKEIYRTKKARLGK